MTDPGEHDETRVMELPPDETGPVPVNVSQAEPRYYGVTPATFALLVASAAFTLAVVFFAIGRWPLGLILLGVSVLLVLLFVEAARRKPQGTVARSSAEMLDTFRARAGAAADSLATRGRAARRLVALRRELHRMVRFRNRLLFELGDAVYRGDDQASQIARGRIEELDALAMQREAEMQHVIEAAESRLEQRRLEVQPTVIAEQPEQPEKPQQPDQPAPGELNPPEPARIPEPYPPPDEATPPQPAVIPEPGPAVIPEPGPQGGGEER